MWRRRCFEAVSGAPLRAFRGPFSCEVSGLFEKNRRIGRKTKKGLARSEVGPLYAPSSTGSSTSLPTECGRSSGVEHHLAKVRVGRSNRLARSSRNGKRGPAARSGPVSFCAQISDAHEKGPA